VLAVKRDRSDRANLLRLLGEDQLDSARAHERLFQRLGATLAWPMSDLRVVEVALRLPPWLRAPFPVPKPVLSEILGDRGQGLAKSRLGGFVRALGRTAVRDVPEAFGDRGLAVAGGFVRPDGLASAADPRWDRDVVGLVGLEVWLAGLADRSEAR
jgi:hypothetical protein